MPQASREGLRCCGWTRAPPAPLAHCAPARPQSRSRNAPARRWCRRCKAANCCGCAATSPSAWRRPAPRCIARTGCTSKPPASAAPAMPRASLPWEITTGAPMTTRCWPCSDCRRSSGCCPPSSSRAKPGRRCCALRRRPPACARGRRGGWRRWGGPPPFPAAGALGVGAALLGGGGVAYGRAGLRRVGCSVLGSTGMHGWASEGTQGLRPNAQSGYIMLMPLPAVRMQLMSHMAATLNIDWLLGLLAQAVELAGGAAPPGARLLERLDAAVLAAAPGQAIYHPYVAGSGGRGPFVDVTARAPLSGLTAGLGLPGLARAVFEGIALAARDCYAALGGPLPEEIRLHGGAARSPALRQLLASVTGRPVRVRP